MADLTLQPRIKVELTVFYIGVNPTIAFVDVNHMRRSLSSVANRGNCFGSPVNIPLDDIHLHMVDPMPINNGKEWVVARGFMFIRDLGFLENYCTGCDGDGGEALVKKLRRGREIVQNGWAPAKFNYSNLGYSFELWASAPVYEDADQMMALVSTVPVAGARQKAPTITLKGVPSEWFTDQTNSSRPSKWVLLNFFEKTGKIRNVDTSEDRDKPMCCNVSIQYENYEECHKALKKLCSFSLKKKDSLTPADYEVTWKDPWISVSSEFKRPCNDYAQLPRKRVCLDPAAGVEVEVEDEDEVQALKHQTSVIQEQLKTLQAKLDALEASKGKGKGSSSS